MNLNRIKTYLTSSDIPYLAVLFICCVVAYWPVSFFVYSLKNDALNYFLPVRYQVSEAISNGHWPFWSPYFNLGYPLHGDMQSGVWNPFVQIISLFGPYTLKTLHYETLLYVFLSGLGMFYLLKYFTIDRRVCLLIAVSYMLCGYNSDSAQFLNWISSASFLPFVILFFYRSIFENSWKACITCGMFFYIYFVSAYPADFIILFYLLLIIFVWHIVSSRKYKSYQLLLPLMKKMAAISIVFLLLSAPAILSYLQFFPVSERGSGTSYKQAMISPLHPRLLFSYVTPLGVWKAPNVEITDPLERNCYFGIIPFAFFLCALFTKTNIRWVRFCKWGFIITLIFSFGEIGGLRSLTYYTLPLMNTFRSPANAKIFSVFFACVISAFAIHSQAPFNKNHRLNLSVFIIFLLIIFLSIWSFSGRITIVNATKYFYSPYPMSHRLKHFLDNTSFSDLLLINVFIQLPFLILLYLYIKKKTSFKWVAYAGIINSVIHTALFMPFTVVKKDYTHAIQNILNNETVRGYPLPDINTSIYENSKGGDKLFNEIGALNMYNKKIGRIDYRITPCNLNTQNQFWNDNNRLRNLLIRYPLLYRADTIIYLKDSTKAYNSRQKVALIENEKTVPKNALGANSSKIIYEKITPNSWDMTISSNESGFYCLYQNYYPGWKLYINDRESKIELCNISFMGFILEKGKHKIKLEYHAQFIKVAFLLSLFCLLIILIVIFKKNKF